MIIDVALPRSVSRGELAPLIPPSVHGPRKLCHSLCSYDQSMTVNDSGEGLGPRPDESILRSVPKISNLHLDP